MKVDTVRLLVPAAAILYIGLALVLPAIRLRRMTGSFGLVMPHRNADTSQRVVGLCLSVCAAAMLGWTAAYSAVGPGALSIWPAPPWVAGLGWIYIVLGALCTFTAQAQMGASWRVGIDSSPTLLVTKGLYAFVRNPIFSGLLLTLIGVVLITPSLWSIVILASALLLVNLQVRAEERHLIALHGEPYLDYASRTGRFLPRIGTLAP